MFKSTVNEQGQTQGCIKLGSANAGAKADVIFGFIFQIGFRRMNRRMPLQRLN
jgi:hypothetical protein